MIEFFITARTGRRLRAQEQKQEEWKRSRDDVRGFHKQQIEDSEEEGQEENRESGGEESTEKVAAREG